LPPPAAEDFTWLDGERLVRFGDGALADAPGLLAARGFERYALLTTERALASAPELGAGADAVLHVPAGGVPEAAAAVRGGVGGRPVVALGGGRVIDAAKAIAGADGLRCAAVPTTLSGAELTGFHRMPEGVERFKLVRPAVVIGVPALMASQAMPDLAASAMNALAHAVEALYTPLSHPVAEMAALHAAAALGRGLEEAPVPHQLGLGALLAGYASGTAGFAVHHVVCQTLVRLAGTPHAKTNAVLLPHVVRLMARHAPDAIGRLAGALGAGERPEAASGRVAELSARAGVTRLRDLGVEGPVLGEVVAAVLQRPELHNTPGPPGEGELRELLEQAL
jgi:alcohol dehydrogenase class IV